MPLSELSSVELMAKLLRESTEKVTIVATGPLTNVGALLLSHPELKEKIEAISFMGGGITYGNWTPAAEFNILVDPEAAKLVLESGLPLHMSGLDVTEQALMCPEDFERVRAVGGEVAEIVAEWLEFFYGFHKNIGYKGAPMHDPCAVAVLTHPELFDIRELCVEVETTGEYCRGTTVGHTRAPANAKVSMGVNRPAFADLLVQAVALSFHFVGDDAHIVPLQASPATHRTPNAPANHHESAYTGRCGHRPLQINTITYKENHP